MIRALGDPTKSSRAKSQPGKTPAGSRSSTKRADTDPVIKPRSAADDERDAAEAALNRKAPRGVLPLIPIESLRGEAKAAGHVDPYIFWQKFFQTDDKQKSSPAYLHSTVLELNQSGKAKHVHAALLGYLRNHSENAESWMYIALALAIRMNSGPESDFKQSLEFAADLAQKSHDANELIKAADILFYNGYYDRVGALLDEAAPKLSHRNEPLKMSVNLAQKTKDPVRMAAALDALLSLGWLGEDAYIRSESRKQVDQLAKTLREEGRDSEAAKLESSLEESKTRDLYVRLSWDGYADFDLNVTEPLGAVAAYQTPRTVFGGALVSNGYGNHPEEVYVCPRAFDGDYSIQINDIWQDPKKKPNQLLLEVIRHEGTPQEERQVFTLKPDEIKKPIVVNVKGGRRKSVLPYIDPVASMLSGFDANPKKYPQSPVRRKPTSPGSEPRQAEAPHPKIIP